MRVRLGYGINRLSISYITTQSIIAEGPVCVVVYDFVSKMKWLQCFLSLSVRVIVRSLCYGVGKLLKGAGRCPDAQQVDFEHGHLVAKEFLVTTRNTRTHKREHTHARTHTHAHTHTHTTYTNKREKMISIRIRELK